MGENKIYDTSVIIELVGERLYIVELFYENWWLKLVLKDLYGNASRVFERKWSDEPPPSLGEKKHYKSVVIGKWHVYGPNEGLSRW